MTATEFEIYVHNTIRARFPASGGWEILEQPTRDGVSRPDFVVHGPDSTIVIDAKDKEALEPADIDQLLGCVAELKARSGVVYVTNDTQIPEAVAAYAKAKGVEVIRTQWWQDD